VTNLIVLRASPDWMRFDLDASRPWLRSVGLAEDLLTRFVPLWDTHFAVDYRSFRSAMKALSLETYRAVKDAALVEEGGVPGDLPAQAQIVFVDDDDWLSPDLFERVAIPANTDGLLWGSVRVGGVFPWTRTADLDRTVQKRPIGSRIYTNNYMVTAGAIARFGRDALFEHTDAQRLFRSGAFAAAISPLYLSAAVKHPCCTLSAKALIDDPDFLRDPRGHIAALIPTLVPPDYAPDLAWLAEPLARFRALLQTAL
jgi:hypothetical protein